LKDRQASSPLVAGKIVVKTSNLECPLMAFGSPLQAALCRAGTCCLRRSPGFRSFRVRVGLCRRAHSDRTNAVRGGVRFEEAVIIVSRALQAISGTGQACRRFGAEGAQGNQSSRSPLSYTSVSINGRRGRCSRTMQECALWHELDAKGWPFRPIEGARDVRPRYVFSPCECHAIRTGCL